MLVRRPYASDVRFIQPVAMALGSAMYVWIATFFDQLVQGQGDGQLPDMTWLFVLGGIWNLLLLVVIVFAIVDAVLTLRAAKTRQLATNAMIVKLISIPYFILNFYVLAVIFVGGGVTLIIGIGFALWVVVAVGIALTYLTMLSTSIYLWAAIARLRRERIIGTGMTVLYAILSFVFVTDLAAGVLVFGHSRRRPRLAFVLLLLSAGAVILGFGIWELLGTIADGAGALNDPVSTLFWIAPVALGFAVIVATGIVSLIRRSTLRLEAQQAAAARRTPTESDPTESVLVG
jgi:hypothetical protein